MKYNIYNYLFAQLKSICFCVLLAITSPALSQSNTYCNPLNLDYGFLKKDSRHAADPVIVLFKDKYYLFTTLDGIGYRVSDNLIDWKYIAFDDKTKKILNLKPSSGYLAPAVATDGQYIYFLRLANPDTEDDRAQKTTTMIRTSDPLSGAWQGVSEIRKIADPHMLFDQGKIYMYYGLGAPSRVFQLDPLTFQEIIGTDKKIIPDYSDEHKLAGWEDITEGGRPYPIREGMWVFKRGAKYYLTYATPGTASKWYSDGVYMSDSAEGPFSYQETTPASAKPGGFIGSAGHSCIFKDRYGNWLQVASMWIGISDQFERRIGIFPVSFSEKGEMHTLTEFGDYPIQMPLELSDPFILATKWNLLTHSKNVTAIGSSTLPGHAAGLSCDESVRTWWSAESGRVGEWLSVDMGELSAVRAVQVNFAEQDCAYNGDPRPSDDYSQYQLLGSTDNTHWQLLVDQSKNKRGNPHDYAVLKAPITCRYLKIVNVHVACGGKFAIRELRAFGNAFGKKPDAVMKIEALRDINDPRKLALEWKPSGNADGYMVHYGPAPDRLFAHFQVTDGQTNTLYLHTLSNNKDTAYYFRVDAYNKNGVANGTVTAAISSEKGYPHLANGTYYIINQQTMMASSVVDGKVVAQQFSPAELSQQWIFEIQADGAYKILNRKSKQVLQINADSKDRGAASQLADWDGRDAQRWFVKFSEKGHVKLYNKNSWYYLEVPNGNPSEGQPLQQNRYFDFPYQEWVLKKEKP